MGGKGRRGARLVQQLPVVLQSCECEVVRRGKAGCCGVAGRRPFSSALWGVPQKHRIRVPRPPGSCRGPDPPVYLCRRPTATGDFVQFAPEAAAAQHWPRDHGAWTGPAAAETAGTEVSTAPPLSVTPPPLLAIGSGHRQQPMGASPTALAFQPFPLAAAASWAAALMSPPPAFPSSIANCCLRG